MPNQQPNYCDIHAHLADQRIINNIENILNKAKQQQVTNILATATKITEWTTITNITKKFNLYGALGIHPYFTQNLSPNWLTTLKNTITNNKQIRAIAEIGLDFTTHRTPEQQTQQIKILKQQLLLAQELNLPVIIHNRRSWSQFFKLLQELHIKQLTGVCHCFGSSIEIAQQALNLDLYLSFGGSIIHPKAKRMHNAIKFCPTDKILSETDTPDLPIKPNQISTPADIPQIVKKIANLKNIPINTIKKQISNNWHKILKIPHRTR